MWWEHAQILLFLLLPHVQKQNGDPFASMIVKHGSILDECLGWGGVPSELHTPSNLFKGQQKFCLVVKHLTGRPGTPGRPGIPLGPGTP